MSKVYNRAIYMVIVLTMIMSLACGIVTVVPGTVNTGDRIYTLPYKRATLAKPPEPTQEPLQLDVIGEKGLP